MIDVSIIIVNFNTKDLLLKCVESIEESLSNSKTSFEIIVVDNCSTDSSLGGIKNYESGVKNSSLKLKIIKNEENVGFSKANNIGVKEARGRYILFLNPDTIVNKNTLETMIDFMDSHKETGAASCFISLVNGGIDDACHRGFPTPWNSFCYFSGLSKIFSHSRIFNGYNMGWENLKKIHEIDACAGAFMIVRREAGEQVGWWDEDYFWYGEDLDFCYRLKKNGWKIFFVPKVSILHYKGVSGGIKNISKELTGASKETKRRATKARFEAMKIFYQKHYVEKYPSFLTWLVMQGVNLRLKLALFNQ